MSKSPQKLRSLYRQLLRELPARQPSLLANPSQLHRRIRSSFAQPAADAPQAEDTETVEQMIEYLRAQRTYITLIERYNPGMNMSTEDRVRLSARRVGMNLPLTPDGDGGGTGQGGKGDGS